MNARERWGASSPVTPPHNTAPGGSPPGIAPAQDRDQPITIGKAVVCKETDGALAEIFTMTLGPETIELMPYKNWVQLDSFKWRTRGLLPRTPPGLEITWERLKFADLTLSPWDPDSCANLERALNEWLTQQRQAQKTDPLQAATPAPAPAQPVDDEVVHFQVDTSHPEQPRIQCLEGGQAVKVVALNQQGLKALIELGFMRKPGSFKVGALHNWVELDGRVFHFKEDPQEARELEQALNSQYLVGAEPEAPPDVLLFPNPASPTGFDIQFPAAPTGVVETRRRHLNEETVQLLQDPEKCRVLRKAITVKFAPPDLIFKLKTPEGGEKNLDPGPDSTVSVPGQNGQVKIIDLSKPISLLGLGAPELVAVFNHPAVNRQARLAAKSQLSRSPH